MLFLRGEVGALVCDSVCIDICQAHGRDNAMNR